jgi:hypothetical protein
MWVVPFVTAIMFYLPTIYLKKTFAVLTFGVGLICSSYQAQVSTQLY